MSVEIVLQVQMILFLMMWCMKKLVEVKPHGESGLFIHASCTLSL